MLEILLISAGAVLETLFIMRSYKRRDASSVVLKTMASVVFVLLGLLELRRMGPSLYGWYVVAGLTLGMLGLVHDGLRGDGRVYRVQPGAVPVLCRRHLLLDER
mgnify:CR=1 FL=1